MSYDIMKVLLELKKTSSRTKKEHLLRTMRDNRDFKKILNYAYDPYKMYGVKFDEVFEHYDFYAPELFVVLDKLASRKLTGNAAREVVEDYAKHHGELIKLICNKDLDCGISATTINSVFPGLIPQFKVQLAKEVPLDKLQYPLYGQIKYDGVRIVTIYKNDGTVLFYTRNGKLIHLPRLEEDVREYLTPGMMYDGEITTLAQERTKVSGMINSARQGGTIDESLLQYMIFDCMMQEEFEANSCRTPYIMRYNLLASIVFTDCHYIRLATTYEIHKKEDAENLYETTVGMGYEGLILKPINHKYTFKRSKDWIKIKEIKTADLKCVGIEEGTGKYYGAVGALALEGIVEGKKIKVKVGSGLTDADRWDSWDTYIGKTIEVKYNAVIQDSVTQDWSLFLPRFVQVRFDK